MVKEKEGLLTIKHRKRIDDSVMLETYHKEYSYIFSILKHVQRARGIFEDADENDETKQKKSKKIKDIQKTCVRLFPALKEGKKPARTVTELQEKLAELRGKPNLVYKEKLLKKGLKNRIKKKEKKKERRLTKKLKKVGTPINTKLNDIGVITETKPTKPIYNSEGNIVFNKFDFTDLGQKNDSKKVIKDPLVALEKLKERQKKMKELESSGKKEIVHEIENKTMWNKAIMKSEGLRVMDDPELLKKSIKKRKEFNVKSKEKWKARQDKVESDKQARQKKRQENIQARIKQKKNTKLKKAAKKGRIIAGF